MKGEPGRRRADHPDGRRGARPNRRTIDCGKTLIATGPASLTSRVAEALLPRAPIYRVVIYFRTLPSAELHRAEVRSFQGAFDVPLMDLPDAP